jgi:hypothetical protein
MGLREVEWEGVNWMHLVQDRDRWRALVNMDNEPSSSTKGERGVGGEGGISSLAE